MDELGIFTPKTKFNAEVLLTGDFDNKYTKIVITQEDLYAIVGIRKQSEEKVTGDLYKIKKIESISTLFDVIRKGIEKTTNDFEEI